MRALAAAAAIFVELRGGVARPGLGERAREGGGLGLGLEFGEKAALHERGDGAGEHAGLLPEIPESAAKSPGSRGAREGVEQRRASSSTASRSCETAWTSSARPGREFQHMGEGGAAQQHRRQAWPADVAWGLRGVWLRLRAWKRGPLIGLNSMSIKRRHRVLHATNAQGRRAAAL